MAYQKPNVSRLTRAAHAAAISRSGGARRAPRMSGVHAMRVLRGGLGYDLGPVTSYDYAGPTGEATVTQTASGGVEYNSWGTGGIQANSGGAGIGTGIMSVFSNLFSSKGTAQVGVVPPTSNTTYLLIGGGVLGIALLYVLLK